MTPTWKDTEASSAADDPMTSYLVPGTAAYRWWKHLGHGYKKYMNQ